MQKIDETDRKILYHLDRNSRQTIKQISKKIEVPETTIIHRMKRMMKMKIIKKFYTVINPFKLGFIPFRFYLRFQYVDPLIENQIINYFAHDPRIWWIGSLDGKYNLTVNMLIKNHHEFLDFWATTLDKYRYYIQDEVFSIYFQLYARNYSYLYINEEKKDIQKYILTIEEKKITLSENEITFLKLLSSSARTPGVELAHQLNISPPAVNYLFKQLEKKEIILGYRVDLDIKKIGFEDYKLDIFLTDYQKRKEIISYLEQNPHLVLLSRSLGISDVEAEFHFENIEKLHAVIKQLYENFPGTIRSCNYHRIVKQYEWNFFPLV